MRANVLFQYINNNFQDDLKNFVKDFILFFRERGREGERKGEKHQLVASCMPLAGVLACNPGIFLDWELNQ